MKLLNDSSPNVSWTYFFDHLLLFPNETIFLQGRIVREKFLVDKSEINYFLIPYAQLIYHKKGYSNGSVMEAEISQIAAHNLWDQVYAVSVEEVNQKFHSLTYKYLFSREFC